MEKKAIYIPSLLHANLKSYAAEHYMKLERLMLFLTVFGLKHIEEALNKKTEKQLEEMLKKSK